jgi:ureidoacrylate peracid hydrolase
MASHREETMPHTHPVQLDAKPMPAVIDPATTALIVVDMQNDFGSKGGMFDRAGIDISGIAAAVAPAGRAIDAARRAGIRIVYLKMGYKPDLSDLGGPDAPNRLLHINIMHVGEKVPVPGGEGRILVRDTWGTDILDALKPEPGDVVLYKTRYSGFYRTELDDILRAAGVTHLIVTGCTTSVCVESTVRDAFFRDYQCVLLSDCIAEPIGAGTALSNHAATLQLIQLMFGRVSTSGAFIDALAGSQIRKAG